MPKKFSDISKIYRHQKIFNILKHCSHDSALSVSEIHAQMIKDGIPVSGRTITRDLEEMSESHKLLSTEGMPARFYVSDGFTPDYQLTFNEEQLQTIILALEGLKQTSPDYLKDLCQKTETILIGKLPREVSEEFSRLKAMSVVKPPMAGESVSQDKECFRIVMKALREGRVFECENHSPYKDKEYNKSKRLFAPLLLNMSGGDPYLFVHDEQSKAVKKVKISRLKEVRILDQRVDKSHLKKINNLDRAIGGYGGMSEPVMRYRVTCTEEMAQMFEEKKIHHTQSIIRKGKDFIISFEANASSEIVRYLAGFGDQIIEIKPAEAYESLKRIWAEGLKRAV